MTFGIAYTNLACVGLLLGGILLESLAGTHAVVAASCTLYVRYVGSEIISSPINNTVVGYTGPLLRCSCRGITDARQSDTTDQVA